MDLDFFASIVPEMRMKLLPLVIAGMKTEGLCCKGKTGQMTHEAVIQRLIDLLGAALNHHDGEEKDTEVEAVIHRSSEISTVVE